MQTFPNSNFGFSEVDTDTLLAQFNKLIADVLKGSLNRNTFRPWEIGILLDIESCELKDGQRREILKRYQRAVQRSMEKGAPQPMKLSEYLEAVRAKRSARVLPNALDREDNLSGQSAFGSAGLPQSGTANLARNTMAFHAADLSLADEEEGAAGEAEEIYRA